MTVPPSGPPPGWYPDPAGSGAIRWWDGYRWTEHTAGPVSWPSPVADPRPFLVGQEQRTAIWGRRALVTYAVVAVATLAVVVGVVGGSFHVLDRWAHQASTASWDGGTAPPLPLHAGVLLVAYPFDGLALAAEVLLLIWQFRAAKAARWLGLPGRHQPGWGVAFWLIPIANLFCPYQAIRDCLPGGHPGRPRVLRWWLLLIAAGVVQVACEVSAVFSEPAGIVLLAVAAGLWCAVVVLGLKVIEDIEASHRTIAGI